MRQIRSLLVVIVLLAMALVPAGARAAFPGRNGKIAFISFRDGANAEIWVMNADGSGQTRLTTQSFGGATDPAWSPDGGRIAFAHGGGISVMNADGTGQTPLTTSATPGGQPAWSPDGQRIAFESARDGNPEIYVMNADGSGQTRLTTDPGSDVDPAWSPDGQRIAFDSTRGGSEDVYVMSANGTGVTPLTNAAGSGFNALPDWSPDGQRIAFASNRDNIGTSGFFNGAEIYVMNADGSGQTRLTTDGVSDEDVSWSPDGQRLAYDAVQSANHMTADAGTVVFTMNANGSDKTPLTSGPTANAHPAWGSLPACPDVQVGNAVAQGCFTETAPGSGVFETDQTAWVGGFEVHPRPGGTLVVNTIDPGVSEGGAGVDVMFAGFAVPLPVSLLPVKSTDATLDLNQAGTLEKLLLDLPLKGKAKVAWSDGGRSSSFDAELSLDKLTEKLGTLVSVREGESVGELAGKFSAKLTNGQGFVAQQAEVKIDEIDVIPSILKVKKTLKLTNLLLRFELKDGKPFWTGGGQIVLPLARGELAVGGEAFVFNGALAGGGLSVDGLNKPIPDTPLFLQKVAGDLLFAPKFGYNLAIGGSLGPRVAGKQLLAIDGSMVGGSLLSSGDCRAGDDPSKLEISAKFTPLDALVDAGFAKTEFTGKSCVFTGTDPAEELTAKVKIALGNAFSYEASQTGFVSVHGLNLEGAAQLRLPALPRLSGQAIISTRGLAACGNVNFFQGGVAYRWGDRAPATFTGCDLGPFRVTVGARAAATATTRTVRVPPRLPFVGFAARSTTAAPRVRVSGPGGVSVSSPAGGKALRSARAVVVPVASERTTYVFVKHPRAGAWRVQGLDGAALTKVAIARGLPRPHVSARVTGKGARRTLSYAVTPLPGQQVRFTERGQGVAHELGRARGRRGRIRFTATISDDRRRSIQAEVVESGLPRADLTVARFTAPKQPKLAKPKIKAKRTKTALTLSWPAVVGATNYLVDVRNGATVLQRLLTPKRKVTFKGTPATGALTVRVRALGASVPPGPVTKAVYGRK